MKTRKIASSDSSGPAPIRHGNADPASVWALRKKKAIAIISQGGSYKEIGEAWGTSMIMAFNAVKKRWPHLAEETQRRRSPCAVSLDEVVRRLIIVRDAPSKAEAARRIGITPAGLHYWLERNAPWGIADALMDYTEDFEDAAQ